MMFAGFFVQTGDRYQMTIPGVIDIRKVHDQAVGLVETHGSGEPESKDLFATLSRTRRQVMGGQAEAHGRCCKGGRPSDIAWWLGVVPFRLAILRTRRQRVLATGFVGMAHAIEAMTSIRHR